MPIYEYYCPDNHRIYQFFAKTLAQGATIPICPDNPRFRMEKIVSVFAIGSSGTGQDKAHEALPAQQPGGDDDPRLEAALGSMEKEFSSLDENDPRAMGRMMRRMAELTGEPIDWEMEEVVRKLEEGTDPEKLEEQLGGGDDAGDNDEGDGFGGPGGAAGQASDGEKPEPKARYKIRRGAPTRDPKLYDYE